jgi:hypothetical protein
MYYKKIILVIIWLFFGMAGFHRLFFKEYKKFLYLFVPFVCFLISNYFELNGLKYFFSVVIFVLWIIDFYLIARGFLKFK